jgi:hypothetical protein
MAQPRPVGSCAATAEQERGAVAHVVAQGAAPGPAIVPARTLERTG